MFFNKLIRFEFKSVEIIGHLDIPMFRKIKNWSGTRNWWTPCAYLTHDFVVFNQSGPSIIYPRTALISRSVSSTTAGIQQSNSSYLHVNWSTEDQLSDSRYRHVARVGPLTCQWRGDTVSVSDKGQAFVDRWANVLGR